MHFEHVPFQCTLLGKAGVTYSARERLLSCVNAHVLRQFPVGRQHLGTVVTDVLPGTKPVYFDVSVETGYTCV